MTGIVKIWGPDYRLYGFIIHSQNSSDSVTEPAHMLINQRPPARWGYEDGPWKGPRPPLLGDADF
jgi:hypothetical protein